MNRRAFKTRVLAAAGALLLAPASGVYAQTTALPAVVTLVAPFAAGGGADQLAREFANFAQAKRPGTTFVVENKPGANGLIAARHVARQKADGSTLLLATSSTHAVGPLISKGDADIVKEFSPVSLLATTANALAVTKSSKLQTLEQFVAAARAAPLTYGTFGAGSSAHLYGLVLARSTQSRLSHVPYKGSSQAITDLMGGHIDSALLTTNALESMAREGKVTILAVTGKDRTRIFPNVKTFEEQGVRQLDFSGWFALFAPKDTPLALREAVAAIAKEMESEPAVARRLVAQGYDWVGSGPEPLQRTLAESIEIYRNILSQHPEVLGG